MTEDAEQADLYIFTDYGGAVYVSTGSVSFTSCTFTGNFAMGGIVAPCSAACVLT